MIDHKHIDRKCATIAAIEARDARALPNPFSHSYSRVAVDKAIAASNRGGRKIGRREAALIHGLLKGPR